MAYFGLEPLSASYLTDYLSGNNTTVAFTLTRAPVAASAVIITISGVKQAASTYGVSGTTLTFSAAPPTGTNNIEVLHLGVQPDTVVQPSYRTITEFTATSGQTTFSPASYTVGYIDVFRNGVKLGTADFTATNGTTVVLNNACSVGDLVRFEAFLITSFNDAIPNTAGAVGDSLIASLSASKLTGSQTLPFGVLPTGSVLQVVQGTTNSSTSSTSTTPTATSLTASITPRYASSKILVISTYSIYTTSSVTKVISYLYRNGSSISSAAGGAYLYNGAGPGQTTVSINQLDSPSTTSSTTYTIYVGTNTGTNLVMLNADTQNQNIILMEIAQ